jgi:hypothetical protein
VREILGRPLVLEKRGLSLHVVLKDRRRRPGVIRAEAMTQLLFELELHLVEVDSPTARGALRHLATVHDALLRKGWAGVADLPSNTLARAVVQAQMVSRRDATSRLRNFIEHLGRLQVAAEVREDRLHHAPPQPLPAQTSAATPSSARTRTSCRLRSFSAGWMASARKHKRSAVVNSVVAKVTCAMSSTLTPAASQARCNCWW